jgi:hypothetical protein
MRFFSPTRRLELTDKDMLSLQAELYALGFGRDKRTEEHARAYPFLDELVFLVEDELKIPNNPRVYVYPKPTHQQPSAAH